MKLRSKLLLSATCLLTISVAATATSAYAWFVSNRQATVAINSATVKTNATNLKIAGATKTADDTASFEAAATAGNITGTLKSNIKATDISGDGVNFFKPKLAPDFGVAKGEPATATYNATSISSVTNSDKNTYYHQFKLTFSQDNADVNTGVFLSSESKVSLASGATSEGLPLCTRVAFLSESKTETGTELLLLRYWAPNRASAAEANESYIKKAYSEATPVSIEDGDTDSSVLQSVTAGTENILKGKTIYGAPEEVNDATDDKDTKNAFLLKLAGKTPQTITVRIWFEGMDDACNSKYLEQTIDANLKFNGVNMDI